MYDDDCTLYLCRSYATGEPRLWSAYNNQEECEANDGTWFTEYGYVDIDTTAVNPTQCEARNTTLPEGYYTVWTRPSWTEPDQQCLILGPPPECDQVGWSRVNHLGNGRDGVPLNYTWRIPSFFGKNKLAVVRIRWVGRGCGGAHEGEGKGGVVGYGACGVRGRGCGGVWCTWG